MGTFGLGVLSGNEAVGKASGRKGSRRTVQLPPSARLKFFRPISWHGEVIARACRQLEDSQADYRVIHRRSADSELTDAPLRPSGRSMGQGQGYFART